MRTYPPTIVIRHRKENLKKCSLRGLEKREDFSFLPYPLVHPLVCTDYILLSLDAPEELSIADSPRGLLLLDATWRYASLMEKNIPLLSSLTRRSLPSFLHTAYPRRQGDCPLPTRGLASIEALYSAYALLQRPLVGLFEHYYWKDSFLEKNSLFLLQCIYERENSTGHYTKSALQACFLSPE